MTSTDIVILLLIGGGAIMGLMRGFVCELLSLIAWGLSVVAIRLFQAPAAAMMAGWIGTSSGQDGVPSAFSSSRASCSTVGARNSVVSGSFRPVIRSTSSKSRRARSE